jgi:hypothetical protein
MKKDEKRQKDKDKKKIATKTKNLVIGQIGPELKN